MSRHKLTTEEKIRGIEKALANPNTPPQFLNNLRIQLGKLKEKPGGERKA